VIVEWIVTLGVGGAILGLVSVIYALWEKRLSNQEKMTALILSTYITRETHDALWAERADRIEKIFEITDRQHHENHEVNQQLLTRIESKMDTNAREVTDRRHKMQERLDEICQRLAMLEARPDDPRLRVNRYPK
jgi:hypothetical protein